MAQWKHEYTEPPIGQSLSNHGEYTPVTVSNQTVDLRLLGSRPADTDSPAELINRTSWSLETTVDDLVKAYRDTPELVEVNQLQIARAYGRLCWLVSALQATERQKLEAAKFNMQAAE